ncbi:MAG: right-handed parallel beta-helix repeat-containing protein [Candidatus Aenigmarchaeota archaeon]|nr:right-handed parallel beta-helix repeat-containing protein [Candidatus Aenigmarchaeota archaeon]
MKVGKKIFRAVFAVVFIAVAAAVGKVAFDAVYPKASDSVNEMADTERLGYITSDEVWSGEIRVAGDIIVPKGVKLIIKPGTKVLVAANKDAGNLMTIPFWLKKGIAKERDQYIHQGEPYRDEENHVTIWIEGFLNATGTRDNKILIKSGSPEPTRYDWNTFHIESGVVSYAEIRDYRAMDLKTGANLTNSELHNVGECPICIHDSTDILIENNWVHDSGHEVVDILRSSPTIINNRFGPSPRFKNPGGYKAGWGGIIVGSGFPTIKNNTIEGFDDAVSFFEKTSYDKLGEQVLMENAFRNNTENVVFNPNPD